ncbi:MAG: sensor domain-containing diguanylate cyclase [Nocardioidaceae bacterium]|nr:sensor domain-containing diguanylate cyclase [Nocardioidaceae bacterium]
MIVGVNMLAEELEARRSELEDRVRDRTIELEQLNHDIMRLAELGNLLQACGDPGEAYEVIEQVVTLMFPGLSGALYLFNASRNLLEVKVAWGHLPSGQVFPREKCWGLRRGQAHLVMGEALRLSCPHTQQRLGDSICIPMAAHGETLGMLHLMGHNLQPGQQGRMLTEAKQQLGVAVAEQTSLALANIQMRAALRQLALRDQMTGLFNRRFVEEWVEREISRADNAGTSLGIIMVDIDHFKQYNDDYGHDAGDAVLGAVAAVIRDSARGGDVPCRYGGEEFLILVADIDRDTLMVRAELLRENVARARVEHLGAHLPTVTVSAGLALYPEHGATQAEVIKEADTALYTAKRRGRNCVVTAGAE